MKKNLYKQYRADEKRLTKLNPALAKMVRDDHSQEYRAQIESIVISSRLAAMPTDTSVNLVGLETAHALQQVARMFNERRRSRRLAEHKAWRAATIAEANIRIQKMAELAKTETPMELDEFPHRLVPTSRQPKIATFLKDVLGLAKCRELFAPE